MLYENLAANAAGHLTFSGYDTVELAQQYGTPVMVMDEAKIRSRCRAYRQAMETYLPAGSHPLYASKALSIRRIYQIMQEENMGVDVVSTGEMYTAARAGFSMENAYFHGNSKTDKDICFAMEQGIGCFVCDNAQELATIDREAGKRQLRQKILLRLTPGIDPHTHEKINTGRIDSKFGAAVETGQAEELVTLALSLKNIELLGYHCHIGSQIFDHAPFCDAAVLMLEFAAEMKQKHGYYPQYVNLGGGMGVPYIATDGCIDYAENIARIGQLIHSTCQRLDITPPAILMEPGRSIVADAGITLYSVTGIKQIPGFKNYVAVDGGMTDNPRYTLYEARYTVHNASRTNAPAELLWTVAGCCCESGDLLQEDVPLPTPQKGDVLAVLTTGAYNYSMASNYNRVPRPPVILLGPDGPYTAVRRETLDDILLCDL